MLSLTHSQIGRRIAAFFVLFLLADASAYKWDEISPEDLAANESQLDPNAPAEVLYKEIIYDLLDGNQQIPQRVIKYHLRTKIYEKSALDQARRTKFWYSSNFKPGGINARVIKPDGSYLEVDEKDVVTQTESRKNGRVQRSTTISLPQVEVGDIVEYKYRLFLEENYYLPKDEVSFQEEWPIRHLILKMKPFVYKGDGFKWASNRAKEALEKGKGGFYEIYLKDQPAYPEEPYQAPDSDARSWFAFYNVHNLIDGENFWKSESKRLYKSMLSSTKADKTVSALAKELAKGKETEDEKLKAFYDYCRSEIIHAYHGKADRLTNEQRDDLNDKWNASKTIDKGFGTSKNINTVFCALARAVGIDARLSRCADRSEYNFTGIIEEMDIALPHTVVGIKKGEDWTFYNPAAKYVPFGQLDWIHNDVGVLVPDKKELILIKTTKASPEHNKAITQGDFELHESGDLSGAVHFTPEGNYNLRLKQILDERTEEDRRKVIEDQLSDSWPNAEVSQIEIQNPDTPFGSTMISCHLKIPNYAEIVGERIFFQPNVEQRYTETEFPSQTRKTKIFFNFPYREESKITIKLPEGYEFEAPSAPHPISVQGLLEYSPKLAINKKTNSIIYNRSLDFFGTSYVPEAYPIIKKSMDDLLAQDQHTLTLKRVEANASKEI